MNDESILCSPGTCEAVYVVLPNCLSEIVLDYFGKPSNRKYNPGALGQWETCIGHYQYNQSVLVGACAAGHRELVAELMKWNEQHTFVHGYIAAIHNGHDHVAKLLKPISCSEWQTVLTHSAMLSNIKLAVIAIAYGADNFYECFRHACHSGCMPIIAILERIIDCDWNEALISACTGDQDKIIALAIAKGATDWNSALTRSCALHNKRLSQMMIANGATQCRSCYRPMGQH